MREQEKPYSDLEKATPGAEEDKKSEAKGNSASTLVITIAPASASLDGVLNTNSNNVDAKTVAAVSARADMAGVPVPEVAIGLELATDMRLDCCALSERARSLKGSTSLSAIDPSLYSDVSGVVTRSVAKTVEKESGLTLPDLAASLRVNDIVFELRGGACTCQSATNKLRLRRSLSSTSTSSQVTAAINVDYVLPVSEELAQSGGVSLDQAVEGAVSALTSEESKGAMLFQLSEEVKRTSETGTSAALASATVESVAPSAVKSTEVDASLASVVPKLKAHGITEITVREEKVETKERGDKNDENEHSASGRERDTAEDNHTGATNQDETSGGTENSNNDSEDSFPLLRLARVAMRSSSEDVLNRDILIGVLFGAALTYLAVWFCCIRMGSEEETTKTNKVKVAPVRHVGDEHGVYVSTPTRPPAAGMWGGAGNMERGDDDQFVVRDGHMVFVSGSRPGRAGAGGAGMDVDRLNAMEAELKEQLRRARGEQGPQGRPVSPPVVGVPVSDGNANGARREPSAERRQHAARTRAGPTPQANFNRYTLDD